MKILHTSDWHLGARLCDRDRVDEHKQFLDWLLVTINRHSIDILLVSGDIFDSTNPPNSAEKLYYNFLCSLNDSNCSATVITGGNHDSISKLDSPKELLTHLSVYVNGGIGSSPEDDIFPISNDRNEIIAIISAIPFLRERDIHIPVAGESWQDRERRVSAGIKDYYDRSSIAASKIKSGNRIPLIAMGHLFATGSFSGSGERDLYVGNLGNITIEDFPDIFSYTALGHIHRPQKVSGREDIRYSGSPLHMDFGEKGEKEVLIVDFNEDRIESIESIKIPIFKKLIRFRGSFDGICANIDNFIDPGIPFLADAEVHGGAGAGDISKILNDKAILRGFEFLRVRITSEKCENIISTSKKVEIKDLSIEEVFLNRCQKANLTSTEADELLPLHNELLVTVQSGECDNEN